MCMCMPWHMHEGQEQFLGVIRSSVLAASPFACRAVLPAQTSAEEFKLGRWPLWQTPSCLVNLLPLLTVLVVSGSDFWWERYQASQEALILPWDNFSGSKDPGEPQAVQSPKLPSCSSIPESQCSGALHPLPSSFLFRI